MSGADSQRTSIAAKSRTGSEPVRPSIFRAYPLYKNSGVQWLEKIPAHWDMARTKFSARLRSGHTPSRQHPEYWQDCTIPWFGLADVWQIRDGQVEYVVDTAEKISPLGLANSAARLLPSGTVILSRTASVGFSAIMGVDMATTQDFVNWVCGPRLRAEYLLYVFRSMQSEFRRLTMGSTHQTIYMPDVGRFSTPQPSLPEQDRIVAFVREQSQRIHALVAKKERLIELLHERRAALIARVVTNGLNSTIPMNESGIKWLGGIPDHWDLKRLWHLTPSDRRIMYGIVLPGPNVEDGIPIVKGGDVNSERLRLECLSRTSREIESGYVRSRLRGGDLVFAIRGSIGEVAMIPEELEGANLTQDAARVAYVPAIHGPWLLYALKSASVFAQLDAGALGATIRGINIRDLKRVSLPVPPRQEQEGIAAFLYTKTAQIDVLVAKVRNAIERLKELRTSLISAAVTGKIDIRGA
jgi:type I restriction enzyme, S subunit